MGEPDLLFATRNSFYIGAYQAAIAEASDLEGLSSDAKVERDSYVYRSYVELGSFEPAINEVDESSPQTLQAVKLLAQYQGQKTSKDAVLATLESWLQDPSTSKNATTLLVAGSILACEGDISAALKACHGSSSLETMALSVQLLLQLHRVDQAEKQLKAMAAADDDSTLTHLCTAWVDLAQGGAKLAEAKVIYQELSEKFTSTARLLNGMAVCHMRLGDWSDAESYLLEAYEKDAKNADTLANLVTVSLHLGKSTARHSSQLSALGSGHAAQQHKAAMETAFSQAAASFVAA